MRYKIIEVMLLDGVDITVCLMNDDDSYTAFKPDENNFLYQAYLAWVAEGNTAEELVPDAD